MLCRINPEVGDFLACALNLAEICIKHSCEVWQGVEPHSEHFVMVRKDIC